MFDVGRNDDQSVFSLTSDLCFLWQSHACRSLSKNDSVSKSYLVHAQAPSPVKDLNFND
jgi:hypothetical protein